MMCVYVNVAPPQNLSTGVTENFHQAWDKCYLQSHLLAHREEGTDVFCFSSLFLLSFVESGRRKMLRYNWTAQRATVLSAEAGDNVTRINFLKKF